MPKTSNKLYKFNNWSAAGFLRWLSVSISNRFSKPVESCPASLESASTRSIEIHEPCGFAIAVIGHGNLKPKFSKLDSSVNSMQNFVQMTHKLARDIHGQKRKYPFYRGDRSTLQKSETKNAGFARVNFWRTMRRS